jgi:hypothetical protein
MERYIELIRDAENSNDLDEIIGNAACDDKITSAEYYKLYRLATEKFYHI